MAILFVDDELMARKYFELLYAKSMEILVADSVEQAIEVLANRAPDIKIVITDYLMKQASGDQLLRYCKDYYPHIKRVLVTGVDTQQFTQEIEDQIFEIILDKPIVPKSVEEILANHG
jgi:two-component system response regulator PhcR